MDSSLLNSTIDSTQLQGIFFYASAIPKFLTEKLTEFLVSKGFNASVRWTGTIMAFFSLLLVYLGIKTLSKVNIFIKIILVMIGLILLVGIFLVPAW